MNDIFYLKKIYL